jgi:acetyltransferase-like isoleucine patch superfamily enzyme
MILVHERRDKMLKRRLKQFLPDEIIQIYRGFHQKRFEVLAKIPPVEKVLVVGAHTYGSANIKILFRDSGEKVIIGKYCSIAPNVTVLLGGGHHLDWTTTYPFGSVNHDVFESNSSIDHSTSKGSVKIGNDVWIGIGATIMSGVSIGNGAVIAANSHVVSDVPAYGIYGGNPARLVKFRFDTETIARLDQIRWWDFSDLQINEIRVSLLQEPTEKFLKNLEEIRQKITVESE